MVAHPLWGHLNYANKYYSDEYNRKAWVNVFHDKAVRDGLILVMEKQFMHMVQFLN
jgi:hypothetical protein